MSISDEIQQSDLPSLSPSMQFHWGLPDGGFELGFELNGETQPGFDLARETLELQTEVFSTTHLRLLADIF